MLLRRLGRLSIIKAIALVYAIVVSETPQLSDCSGGRVADRGEGVCDPKSRKRARTRLKRENEQRRNTSNAGHGSGCALHAFGVGRIDQSILSC
jgi:hypothetical protein